MMTWVAILIAMWEGFMAVKAVREVYRARASMKATYEAGLNLRSVVRSQLALMCDHLDSAPFPTHEPPQAIGKCHCPACCWKRDTQILVSTVRAAIDTGGQPDER